ncbi:MAG: gliding motility lipoprotein GldH [Bacteroidales bacterium]|nr:gliding motility lipoprotein GldH [Bacteroidales bacterium]
MKTIRYFLVFTILVLALWSCRTGYLFDGSKSLDTAGWLADDFVQFTAEVEDLDQEFDIDIHLRYDGRYAYSNLFLFIDTYAPTGVSLRDTLECMFADRSGRWLGRGIGGHYTLEVPYKQRVKFPYKGSYRFKIQHGMRAEKLEHIKDIGISIKRIKAGGQTK